MPMTSGTTKALSSVDCPSTQNAVACGAGGTVLRLSGTTWSAVAPAFPSSGSADIASCKLVGTTLWAAGDNFFYKLDLAAASPAWVSLPAQPKLSQLLVVSPYEVYAMSGATKVVRFDGSAWDTRFTLNSGALLGGSQVGGKVVYAGRLGVVVEGQ